ICCTQQNLRFGKFRLLKLVTVGFPIAIEIDFIADALHKRGILRLKNSVELVLQGACELHMLNNQSAVLSARRVQLRHLSSS
ncbi:hypothetical protein, partial [Roseomonas mucosa]|uniref:hypothetical protein n=1 Tax=Roseomonas mucosa TaxID=207340 RepID=UPI0037C82F26